MIGTQLGSYTILEEIGRGGMAVVYRAHQPSVDRYVALKVIQRNIFDDATGIERFQREARLIARLEHIHILPVYDFDGRHEPPYIVMRLLQGGTLKEVIRGRKLPLDEIAYLLRQIGAALDYAHRQGIVHRDIKPSNIMVDRDGNAFVTDFGIARQVEIHAQNGSEGLTQSGTPMGTPDYMPPEQARGESNVDHRADIYSMGVMLFQMLTHQLPYTAKSPVDLIIKHLHDPIPSAYERNPQLPPAIDLIIERALAKKSEDRYPSILEMVNEFTDVLGGTAVAIRPTQIQAAAEETMILSRQKALSAEPATSTPVTPTEQNKTVTALHADAGEYAQIVEETDSNEVSRSAMQRLWAQFEQITLAYGGRVFARGENNFLALWGADTSREDDPEQAIRAALILQATLRDQAASILEAEEALPLRIGINTGLALLTPNSDTGDFTASGATITLANRLAENAFGTVLISPDTFRAVSGIFDIEQDVPLKLRGRKDPLPTYRIIQAKARAFRIEARGIQGVDTAMIGREAERKFLQNAFEDAVEESETRVITVISEAGLGKSRLLYEFDQWSELHPVQFRIFQGRATSSMTQRPYALLRDLLSFRFEILDSDKPDEVRHKLEAGIVDITGADSPEMAHLIGHLVGFDLSESPHIKGLLSDPQQLTQRAKQLFKRLFVQVTDIMPVVVQLEDAHLSDNASLDLLNDLVTEQAELRLLVMYFARPALLEHRPTWGAGQDFHRRITLQALDKRESRNLAAEILKRIPEVPKMLRDLLVDQSEGNPYFMEETIKMLIDDHVIVKGEEVWTVEESRLANLRVPPTLIGLLQARLDTLLYPEKLALQRAAVIGRVFYDKAILALDAADDARLRDIPQLLEALVKREFIYKRETTGFAGQTEYIFAQNMMRDIIYNVLLKRQLKTYHVAAAEWLINAAGERLDEYLPLIAEHYENGEAPEQAVHFLIQAGDKAMQLGAIREAIATFTRAETLINEEGLRLVVQIKLSDALRALGELANAQPRLDKALLDARRLNDTQSLIQVLYLLSQVATDRGDWDEALHYLDEGLPLARAGSDQAALGQMLFGLADTHFRIGNADQSQALAEECLHIARQIADVGLQILALNRLGTLKFYTHPHEAQQLLEECLQLARRVGNRDRESAILCNLGIVFSNLHDLTTAIRYTEDALKLERDIGNLRGISISAGNIADYYSELKEIDKARPFMLEAIHATRQMGSVNWLLAMAQTLGFFTFMSGKHADGFAILGLVLHHPASGSEVEQDMERVLKPAREQFSEAEIQAMMDKGKKLDLDTVIDAFLNEEN